jgi:hypothetical protein
MAQENFNVSEPNDDLGDKLRAAFIIGQNNFTDLYTNKVDKEDGKGLSTENYTSIEKDKLANIQDFAEVNVQVDWLQNDDTQDDYLKNKGAFIESVNTVVETLTPEGFSNIFVNSLAEVTTVNGSDYFNFSNDAASIQQKINFFYLKNEINKDALVGENHILLILKGNTTQNADRIQAVFDALPNNDVPYSIMTLGGTIQYLPNLGLRPFTSIGSLDKNNRLVVVNDFAITFLNNINFLNVTINNIQAENEILNCNFDNVTVNNIQAINDIIICKFDNVTFNNNIQTNNITECKFDNVTVNNILVENEIINCKFDNVTVNNIQAENDIIICKFYNVTVNNIQAENNMTECKFDNVTVDINIEANNNMTNCNFNNVTVGIDIQSENRITECNFNNVSADNIKGYNDIAYCNFTNVTVNTIEGDNVNYNTFKDTNANFLLFPLNFNNNKADNLNGQLATTGNFTNNFFKNGKMGFNYGISNDATTILINVEILNSTHLPDAKLRNCYDINTEYTIVNQN